MCCGCGLAVTRYGNTSTTPHFSVAFLGRTMFALSLCVSLSGCTSQNLFGSVERWVQKWTTNNQSWGRGGDINLGIGNSGLKLQWDLFPASTAGKELFLLMCKYVASVCTLLLSQHLCLPYVFQVQRWKAFICSGLFLCHSFQNTSDRYKSSS